MRASTGGHKRIGEFLLNCGADVDDEDCVSRRSDTALLRSDVSTITSFAVSVHNFDASSDWWTLGSRENATRSRM